jgi:hypothetical protein
MYRKIWERCKSSVCSIDFLSSAGTKIISFTGFKVKDYLITDDIVDKFAKPAEVWLRFTEAGMVDQESIRMSFKEFVDSRVRFGSQVTPGFIMLDIKREAFRNIPPLLCSKRINHVIGQPIAVLGYQLDQENLAIKYGIISSTFLSSEGINTIQVDCTIRQGNAGSPLICAETMEVIGIIGHRLSSIARDSRAMMRIINTNLKVLREAEGKINMEDIDPIQVLIANQNQIKHVMTEFYKATNMRVGFAVELSSMTDYCPDYEEDIGSIETEFTVDN